MLTSADRLDATAVNIMEAYYVSIDKLCEAHEILDRQPTRFMNFDELGMNNRGEYEKKGSLKSSFFPPCVVFCDVRASLL
jgi:hypothetical protein